LWRQVGVGGGYWVCMGGGRYCGGRWVCMGGGGGYWVCMGGGGGHWVCMGGGGGHCEVVLGQYYNHAYQLL